MSVFKRHHHEYDTESWASLRHNEAHREEMEKLGKNPDLPLNHPVNALSPLRKLLVLCSLSYSGCLMNFIVAIILVAYVPMGKDFGVPTSMIPQTVGYQLLGMSVGPLVWNPLSRTVGRRPTYLIASFIVMPLCVWMALAKTYASFAIARVICGIVGAFSQTLPPTTVADIFRVEVRGHQMSMYGVAIVIAPAMAPLFSALIIHKSSWRNLFWFSLGLAGVQFLLYLFFVPETLWVEDDHSAEPPTPMDDKTSAVEEDEHPHQATLASHIKSGHPGVAWYPWQRPKEYMWLSLGPILMLRFAVITIPSFYYGLMYAWSVGLTVVLSPLLSAAPYHFAIIPLGAAFLACGIGGILGKWSGGLVGDKVVAYFERRNGRREPEDRLWALLPIFPFMFISLLIFGLGVQRHFHWAVLLVMAGMYYFALSAATGVLTTYVLESYLARSMDTQAVFQFWKKMWGFAVAFFAMKWGRHSGFLIEYAVEGVLASCLGAIIVVVLLWKGKAIRMAQGMPEFEK